jgi:hypothetical protein
MKNINMRQPVRKFLDIVLKLPSNNRPGKAELGGAPRLLRGRIFDQAAFVHLLDEVVDRGALGLAVADRPAQVVVGFVDRGVLAVRLPFDQDGYSTSRS